MEPHVQYVRSGDGTNIAYSVIGERDGVPMIFAPNIWCHLEMQLTRDFRETLRIARRGHHSVAGLQRLLRERSAQAA